jgi:tetratricopeptide (TPR) repeat protein
MAMDRTLPALPAPPTEPPSARLRWLVAIIRLSVLLLLAGMLTALVWQIWRRTRMPEPPLAPLGTPDPAVSEAIEAARAEVLAAPRAAKAWGQLGMLLLAYEFRPEASFCFAQAEQLDPRDERWPYLHALALLRDEPDTALYFLQKASEYSGRPMVCRLELGDALLNQGRGEEAERVFRDVLQMEPDNPRAFFGLGRAAYLRSSFEVSREYLRRAAGGAPRTIRVRALLAQVYFRLDERSGAERELRALEQNPADVPWPDPYQEAVRALKVGVDAKLAVAEDLVAQGRRREANQLLTNIVQTYPDSYMVHQQFGRFLFQTGEFDAAEKQLRAALSRQSNSVQTLIDLGRVLQTRRDYRAAAECYRKVVQLKPQDGMACYYLAQCCDQLSDRSGSLLALQAAVRFRPDLAPAHRDLGLCLIATGRIAPGWREIETGLRLSFAGEKPRQVLAQMPRETKPR